MDTKFNEVNQFRYTIESKGYFKAYLQHEQLKKELEAAKETI